MLSLNTGVRKYYEAALGHAAVLVCGAKANLYGLQVENNDAADVFVHFYDSDSAGSPGSIVWTLKVEPNSELFVRPSEIPLHEFSKGIVVLASASRSSATSVTGDPTVALWYRVR